MCNSEVDNVRYAPWDSFRTRKNKKPEMHCELHYEQQHALWLATESNSEYSSLSAEIFLLKSASRVKSAGGTRAWRVN